MRCKFFGVNIDLGERRRIVDHCLCCPKDRDTHENAERDKGEQCKAEGKYP